MGVQTISSAWQFRLLKYLIRKKVRGCGRLFDLLQRRGYFKQVILCSAPGVTLEVPLYRPDNCMDDWDFQNYERDLLDTAVGICGSYPGDLTLVDCGADIGVFSALMVSRLPNISSICAIEPNPDAYEFLQRNMQRLGRPAKTYCAAVSNVHGKGALVSSPCDPADHAKFITPQQGGSVSVITIDSLSVSVSETVVLKLDVEGAELNAIRGAERTIRSAHNVVVIFEAHGGVTRRTGIDPLECIKILEAIRSFEFIVGERPSFPLMRNRKVFDQLNPAEMYNIVAVSR